MGVVYHTHYVDFFEAARTELLRSTGTTYREVEEAGISMPVIEVTVKYHRPAKYDDMLLIVVKTQDEAPTVRVRFDYEVLRKSDNMLLATGTTTLCFLDQSTGRPCRAPEFAARWFENE